MKLPRWPQADLGDWPIVLVLVVGALLLMGGGQCGVFVRIDSRPTTTQVRP